MKEGCFLNRLLLIEDDFEIKETVKELFSYNAKDLFVLDLANDFVEGLIKLRSNRYDLVMLDMRLSLKAGPDISRLLREHCRCPVVAVIDPDVEEEMKYAYEIIADDLAIRSFAAFDLYEAALEYSKGQSSREQILEYGGIRMNMVTGYVTADGSSIDLSPKAAQLLMVLLENKNVVLSRDILLSKIWGEDYQGSARAVDSQVRTLRKQLGVKGNLIRTVKDKGYMIGGK